MSTPTGGRSVLRPRGRRRLSTSAAWRASRGRAKFYDTPRPSRECVVATNAPPKLTAAPRFCCRGARDSSRCRPLPELSKEVYHLAQVRIGGRRSIIAGSGAFFDLRQGRIGGNPTRHGLDI